MVKKRKKAKKKATKKKSTKKKSKNKKKKSVQIEEEKNNIISNSLDVFIDNIESFETAIKIIMLLMVTTKKKAAKARLDYLVKHGKLESRHKNKSVFLLPFKYSKKFQSIKRDHVKTKIAYNIIPQSFIVMLVSQFDYLIGRIVYGIYSSRTEMMNAIDREFKYSELKSLGSIKKVEEALLEKEIDVLLRKSHSEQYRSLQEKFNIELVKYFDDWPFFIELTERRNLFVHANGKVNNQYLRVCRKYKVEGLEDVKIDDVLDVSPEYFKKSYNCLFEIAVITTQFLWRKIFPNELALTNNHLLHLTYNLLKTQQYELAIKLLNFACSPIIQYPDDVAKRMHIINKAMAYKWFGDEDECQKILDSEDWSSSIIEFKLAIEVLKDRFQSAANIMLRIGKKTEHIVKSSYYEWPLFNEFRNTKIFNKTFTKIYNEPFEIEAETSIKIKKKKAKMKVKKKAKMKVKKKAKMKVKKKAKMKNANN